MDENRSLYDIFSSIHSMAKKQEEVEQEKNSAAQQKKCMCGRIEHEVSLHQSMELDPMTDGEDKDPIYLEKTKKGSQFKVCPVCDPKPHCLLCGGTGHKLFLKDHHVETDEGQFNYASDDLMPNACSCVFVHKVVSFLNQAQIPDKYIHAEISSFVFDHLNDPQKKKLQFNIKKMQDFCTAMSDWNARSHAKKTNQKYFAMLFGPVGCGKTLLATTALKHMIMQYGLRGQFVDFQYLLSQLRAEYDERKTGENILQKLRTIDVLVIDEFGKGRHDKEWQLEKLDDLVNSRYNAKKTTIITTNYLPQNFRYEKKEIPTTMGRDLYSNDVVINESFWNQTLPERVGMRMYERILEVSEFFDMTGIPSYRRVMGRHFLDLYSKNA